MIAIVEKCSCERFKKSGKDRKGQQRYKCLDCGRRWIAARPKPIGDMRVSLDKATLALNLLLEGMSIRAAERISGLNRDTICNLILVASENCQRFLSQAVRNVAATDVQADEIWSFNYCKQRTAEKRGYGGECGDSWTFVAIERNTKLILAHHVAKRDGDATAAFLGKLKAAVSGRFQLTCDGFGPYQYGVPMTFRGDVDFAQLIKVYKSSQEETRYSPAQIIKAERITRTGSPDPSRISTSHVERGNLTLRMQVRRFTRLTNAHSKSLDHHIAMQAIYVAWYNYCRVHETIKTTPAVASGLAKTPWTLAELLTTAAHVV